MHRWLRWANQNGLLMVAVGFLLRLASVAAQLPEHLDPAHEHWRFGWEMGRVAHSLYLGHGFASPTLYPTPGATAWMAPVYPYLIATGFRLFGLYSLAAAWFILGINALCGALTALPVRAIAARAFPGSGSRPAMIAGWLWTLLPYAIYICGERIWENSLTTLLAAMLLWLTYVIEEHSGMWRWLLWGALWALAGLTSPALLSVLPPLGLWIALRHYRAGRPWLKQATAAALVFAALLAPWTMRNYQLFHRLIPLRDNLWLEVHVGNHGDDREPCPDGAHPSSSEVDRRQWAQLGEIGYMDAKRAESLAWIDEHPAQYAVLTARRTAFVWTGFWSASARYLHEEPMEPYAAGYFTALALLAAFGVLRARRSGYGGQLWPLLWILLIFPIPYYLAHPGYEYRHPLDPVLVVLVAYATAKRRVEAEPLEVEEPVFGSRA